MNQFKRIFTVVSLLSVLTLAPAFADHHNKMDGETAVAVVETTNQRLAPQDRVLGHVRFTQKNGKVHVTGRLEGLEPNSTHGFHIHQYGDFTKMDGTSAGGHFNPKDTKHAGPDAPAHHAGDLGNVTADDNGVVELDMMVDFLSISAGPHAILGRAVVLHAGPDDLSSQPSGAAGPRIGVGIIGWANPES